MDMYVTDWGLTRDEVNQIASDSEKLMDLLVNVVCSCVVA